MRFLLQCRVLLQLCSPDARSGLIASYCSGCFARRESVARRFVNEVLEGRHGGPLATQARGPGGGGAGHRRAGGLKEWAERGGPESGGDSGPQGDSGL